MSDLIIDGQGTIMPAGKAVMMQRYGQSARSKSLLDFLVRNMGFVRVRLGQTSVSVIAAPGQMKFRTYSAMAGLIDKRSPERVSLSWFDDGWNHEIHVGVKPLCRRLLGLMKLRGQRRSDQYISEPRSVDTLPNSSTLRAIVDCWAEKSGQLNVDDCPTLFHDLLLSKFSVGQFDEDTGRIVFSDIGDGITICSTDTKARIIGQPVDEMPDIAYGRAIVNDWRFAMLKLEPTLVDVDAFVAEPGQKEIQRRQYTRLMLPINRKGAQLPMLLCASLIDHAVNFHGDFFVSHAQHQSE